MKSFGVCLKLLRTWLPPLVPNKRRFTAQPGVHVFIEVYGCRMNQSDAEIARSIIHAAGLQEAQSVEQANTVLLMTCAIRESAELKIWKRLHHLRLLSIRKNLDLKLGVLGCMAERLKERLLSPNITTSQCDPPDSVRSFLKDVLNARPSCRPGADFVCGPDAYRDLPALIRGAHAGQYGASVALSLEETYADVTPVRRCQPVPESAEDLPAANGSLSPFAQISVMRGCDNMCTYCIVPFVRGRERSRSLRSIVDESKQLFNEGVKEITLLGQNVNSYCDRSKDALLNAESDEVTLTPGFRTVYRPKRGGRHFADLLDEVSQISPELRIRFTSPHPKDFPIEVLQLIAERANICSHLHLPAQSGSRAVLDRMGRGYTPEAYSNLVETVRKIIPDVALTSDFITGFCGETDADHEATADLVRKVGYAFIFCYPFSMREKTRAYHRLVDDVPQEVKTRRFEELRQIGRQSSLAFNQSQIGRTQLILIEGASFTDA